MYKMSFVFTKKEFDFSAIYKITSPSNKIYIGQTQSFYKRFYDYRKPKANKYLLNAILKYGIENMSVEILEKNISLSDLNSREKFYFDLLKPFNENGYNICETPYTTRGRKRTSSEMKGISEFRKSRIGELNHFFNKKHSQESIDKISKAHKNKVLSDLTKQNISKSLIGVFNKKIAQIDLVTREIICIYDSIKEAFNETNIKMSNISQVANKRFCYSKCKTKQYLIKSAGGYYWEFI